MRFRLRTLMIVMFIAGASPWLALRYLDWQRDRALVEWRATFSPAFGNTESRNLAERQAQERYFAARERAIYAWSLVGVDRRKSAQK